MRRVKGYRYLFRRGEQFYFRRRVPKGMEWAFNGRDQVPVALRTSSLVEARHALAVEIAKFDGRLATAKGQQVSRVATKIAATHLPSREEIEEQVRIWLRDRSERLSASFAAFDRTGGDANRRLDELKTQSNEARKATGLVAAEAPLHTEWIAEAFVHGAGWSIEKGTDLWRHLVRLIARGQIEGNSWEEQEIAGEPRIVMDDRFSSDQYRLDIERAEKRKSAAAVSLKGLLEGYIAEAELAPATVKVWRRQVSAFADHLGHDNAQAVKQSDVVSWKEHLLNEPRSSGNTLSARTVRDTYLAVLKTVFAWAASNGKIDQNPTAGVRVAGKRKPPPRDRGFTDEEAETVLKATLGAMPKRLSQENVLARRWVPWICAYTGARVGEICQLRSEDIVQRDGIWTIRITPEAGTVKNHKARTVAIHSHLIEQKMIPVLTAKKGPIFYDPDRHRGGSKGNPQYKKVGERLAAWIRTLGVDDENIWPNHAWRHRFTTQARLAGVDLEIRNAIQGHAPAGEGHGYGDLPPKVSQMAIEKLPRYEIDGA